MNKNHLIQIVLLGTFLFLGLSLQAQTIEEQFKTVVDGSNNYQDYKVIKQSQIKGLWKNTIDSLNHKQAQYHQIATTLKDEKAAIAQQKVELANKEKSLQETLDSAEQISLLGVVDIKKSNYKIFMWSLTLILAVLAAVFYFTAFATRKEARYRIKLFEEVQEEFKNFKAKANENEKRLARALQDERNKLAENNIH